MLCVGVTSMFLGSSLVDVEVAMYACLSMWGRTRANHSAARFSSGKMLSMTCRGSRLSYVFLYLCLAFCCPRAQSWCGLLCTIVACLSWESGVYGVVVVVRWKSCDLWSYLLGIAVFMFPLLGGGSLLPDRFNLVGYSTGLNHSPEAVLARSRSWGGGVDCLFATMPCALAVGPTQGSCRFPLFCNHWFTAWRGLLCVVVSCSTPATRQVYPPSISGH